MANDYVTPIHLSERFTTFVDFLGANGGRYQARLLDLEVAIGIPGHALRRITARAADLGIVRVDGNAAIIGMGRLPNTYTLAIPWDEWPAMREQLAKDHANAPELRRQKRNAARAAERARDKAEREAAARAPKRIWPPPVSQQLTAVEEARAEADLDVDTWADVGGF